MLDLPISTKVTRSLPKTSLYKQFDWSKPQRDRFDADISRLDFIHWISPRTVPAVAAGDEVKEIFVIEVTLKRRDYDPKSIILLGKSLPQRVVYLLRHEDDAQLAVYHTKLFTTGWEPVSSGPGATPSDSFLTIQGLNLDTVWQNFVSAIGQFAVSGDRTLSEQIKDDEAQAKLQRQIDKLEKQMRAATQPRRQRELYAQLRELRRLWATRGR